VKKIGIEIFLTKNFELGESSKAKKRCCCFFFLQKGLVGIWAANTGPTRFKEKVDSACQPTASMISWIEKLQAKAKLAKKARIS